MKTEKSFFRRSKYDDLIFLAEKSSSREEKSWGGAESLLTI